MQRKRECPDREGKGREGGREGLVKENVAIISTVHTGENTWPVRAIHVVKQVSYIHTIAGKAWYDTYVLSPIHVFELYHTNRLLKLPT